MSGNPIPVEQSLLRSPLALQTRVTVRAAEPLTVPIVAVMLTVP